MTIQYDQTKKQRVLKIKVYSKIEAGGIRIYEMNGIKNITYWHRVDMNRDYISVSLKTIETLYITYRPQFRMSISWKIKDIDKSREISFI